MLTIKNYAYLLIVLTVAPFTAWSGVNDAPACTKIKNFYLPRAFEIALMAGEDPDYKEFADSFPSSP